VKPVIIGVHVFPMGVANAFLIKGDDGLTLIDAGFPNKEAVAPVIASVRRFLWAEVVFFALIPPSPPRWPAAMASSRSEGGQDSWQQLSVSTCPV
jgi:hypothetical protein